MRSQRENLFYDFDPHSEEMAEIIDAQNIASVEDAYEQLFQPCQYCAAARVPEEFQNAVYHFDLSEHEHVCSTCRDVATNNHAEALEITPIKWEDRSEILTEDGETIPGMHRCGFEPSTI